MSESRVGVVVVSGFVVEESGAFTLAELSRAGNADVETLIAFVEEGVISVEGADRDSWRFSGAALGRVRRAMRLSRDLELNAAGVAMALDLMDEIARLDARLRRQGSDRR